MHGSRAASQGDFGEVLTFLIITQVSSGFYKIAYSNLQQM